MKMASAIAAPPVTRTGTALRIFVEMSIAPSLAPEIPMTARAMKLPSMPIRGIRTSAVTSVPQAAPMPLTSSAFPTRRPLPFTAPDTVVQAAESENPAATEGNNTRIGV